MPVIANELRFLTEEEGGAGGFWVGGVKSTIPQALSIVGTFTWLPADAELDLEFTSSNEDFIVFQNYNASYNAEGDFEYYVSTWSLPGDLHNPPSGSSILTIRDKNSGLQLSRTVYNNYIGTSPNIYITPSAVTVNPDINLPFKFGDIVENGCAISGTSLSYPALSGLYFFVQPDYIQKSISVDRMQSNYSDTPLTSYLWGSCLDTSGNTYVSRLKLTQLASGTPTGSYIRFVNSAATVPAQTPGLTTPLEYSGCTVDTGTCEIVSVVGDIPITGAGLNYNSYEQRYDAWLKFNQNVTPDDRSSVVTVRFYDTDGNSYESTITIYQPAEEYLTYVYGEGNGQLVPQEGGTYTDEVVPINTRICSVQLVSSGIPYNPEYWEGVEKPTISIIGNYINIDWPANPFEHTRVFRYSIGTIYGDNCETYIGYSFFHTQEAYEAPGNKSIEADTTEYNAASGGGDGSTVIQTTGCTYDHFTYITGGSFSVTATSGPNNTIIFTYPENPTTSARTGYVYVTYYDEDGNPYGPQTITFNQQAGSSPGPGPGPEPESGYVLTSLTISDQEQHRYFVEARPGIVYSAAGQYYKTVLACEARYSLYYVNSYGGVDVLPFKEKGWKKSDTVTRFNYSRSFRNNTLEFENVNYMNEIKASWELHTGWMSDESSQRMHELVESTIVYLYDAEEKTYTPVVMTDKKLEYKTYHNQGKKFYNYTVNVEESQSKERR